MVLISFVNFSVSSILSDSSSADAEIGAIIGDTVSAAAAIDEAANAAVNPRRFRRVDIAISINY